MEKDDRAFQDETAYLVEKAQDLGVHIPPECLPNFIDYCNEVIFWNAVTGITSYRSKKDIYTYMFLDSIAGVKVLDRLSYEKVIDCGTGGGFPGLPLKIMRPQMDLTLIDSSSKKVEFLKNLVRKLQLRNVTCESGRIEKIAHLESHREKFDIALSRALAGLPVALELTLPLLRINGRVLAWKGPRVKNELEQADIMIRILGCKVEEIFEYRLPGLSDMRNIVIVRKLGKTPQIYPRKSSRRLYPSTGDRDVLLESI